MNVFPSFRPVLILGVFLALGLVRPVSAGVQARISVKFIHNNDGGSTRPSGRIGTSAGFTQEIDYGNVVLDATSRANALNVIEFIEIQPPAPTATSVSRTCGTTANSATVTCTNTSGLQNFMRVQGTGIPANTVIVSIVANTSFTLSSNATATNPSVSLTGSFPADHWFNLDARASGVRQYIETTALAATSTWAWNPNAINIYVNNSSSGQCAFVGSGSSISLGSTVNTGTVLHEIGHLFDLRHTHALDYSTNTNPPNNMPPGQFAAADLMDGDGLAETANDNPNITTNDQLCQALFGKNYNGATTTDSERAVVDSAFQNVMSYHSETRFLSVQMDKWTLNANAARLPFCTGRTWFVAVGGNNSAAGNAATVPLATVAGGVSRVTTPNDVVLLRAGSYAAPAGGTISTPCTLAATRGEVIIHFP